MKKYPYRTIVAMIAPLAWGGLLLFTYLVVPSSLFAILMFFGLLSLALMCSFFPLTHFLGQRLLFTRRYRATNRQALRQAGLLTIIILANLALRALHSWNILTAFIIIIAAVIVEILSLARKI
ncbi:hypothetical protein [Dictyobacter formicarum]|uniref:Uncharacterized protein n=1 Tax=Dictyobacter formicarum TaxID=2778368 RepID=A0ABQ3VP07_9CHLR|nr:hypothetical protein [Dictyobacter formicarum]GHO86821.1 hypothetical protein KSZ_48270 [Dictyobacter formicarum]